MELLDLPMNTTVIFERCLSSNKGSLPFSDSSSPEEIRAAFQTSKQAFKQALGNLYRQRLVELHESGIRLIPKKSHI